MRLSIAGDFGYRERLFERSEFRDRRNTREAQGTPQGPHSWVAFLLVRFLWRSKENELARQSETPPLPHICKQGRSSSLLRRHNGKLTIRLLNGRQQSQQFEATAG